MRRKQCRPLAPHSAPPEEKHLTTVETVGSLLHPEKPQSRPCLRGILIFHQESSPKRAAAIKARFKMPKETRQPEPNHAKILAPIPPSPCFLPKKKRDPAEIAAFGKRSMPPK